MDQKAIEAILGAIRAPVMVELDEEHRFALVPENMKAVDLKPYLPPPARIKQAVELLSVPAFLEYLARYATIDSLIFANESAAEYAAVLDYHPKITTAGEASNRGQQSHVAHYRCPQSDQWKIWNGTNGKMTGQEEFASFIEANLRDIVTPPGADMLQLCLQLQVHKSAAFESGIRMDNGQVQFRYVETIKGTTNTKAGDLEIPTEFTLQLPVFVDGTVFLQGARFKYRMTEGKLSLGYELIRPLETFTAAVKQVTTEIVKGAQSVKLVQGVRR